MPREYTHVKELLAEIKLMAAEGKTQREIAAHFGFKDKLVVKELLKRDRRNEEKRKAGISSKQPGRKPAVTLQEYKYENNRLKMENELLRDFLRHAGRR
jgi:hypothetical protein